MEFGYGDVTVDSALHRAQLQNTHDVLMNLSEDSLASKPTDSAGAARPSPEASPLLPVAGAMANASSSSCRAACGWTR